MIHRYGLLGPSGCGKTTLLSCIVNQLSLDHGKILLFGFQPGTPEASIPGERVGFMPQVNQTYFYFKYIITVFFFYLGTCFI